MLGDHGHCGDWTVAWSRRGWRRQAGEGGRGGALDLASKSASDALELCGLGQGFKTLEPQLPPPVRCHNKTNLGVIKWCNTYRVCS